MQTELLTFATLIPIVTAIVQALKQVPAIKKRPALLPFAAMAVGLILSGALVLLRPVGGFSASMAGGLWILGGVISGLAASGLYSGAGKLLGKFLGLKG